MNRLTATCIERLRSDSSGALKELYDKYYETLVLFGTKYVAEQAVVEDIVQETFIKVWEKRHYFFQEEALRAFLYKSVRNACLNQLEHVAVHKKYTEEAISNLRSEEYFLQNVISEEVQRIIHETVEKLPAAAKTIYLMSLNGYKNLEIAEDLGISVNTVKTQKLRAKRFLQENLKKIHTILIWI